MSILNIMYIFVHYVLLVKGEIKNSAHLDTSKFLRYLNMQENKPTFINLFWITDIFENLMKAIASSSQKKKPNKHICAYAMKFCLHFHRVYGLSSLPMNPRGFHELWVKNLCNKPTLCIGKIENLPLESMTV